MKLKRVTIKDFRHFTGLTVQGIPETTRLIMLAGPNGSGKSSFFDALYTWHKWTSRKSRTWESDYHIKAGSPERTGFGNDVTVEFHDSVPGKSKKAIYVRSAYRNDPEFRIGNLGRMGSPLDQVPFQRMIDNDTAVSRNYQRLVSKGVEDLYKGGKTTFDEYLEGSIGDVREPLGRLFSELQLDDLENPLEDGTFRFTKGESRGFVFKNLSGGEKAAFDLILDMVIMSRYYDDTIYCIDEPESHMNARLQAELLSVLYELIPDNCQLMLATHSIGMMRRARDIETESPGTVVFLDFEGFNFDQPQTIEPAVPNRRFWKSAYDVALADLAALIAPSQVVICEGEPVKKGPPKNYSLDANCYGRIFEDEFPDTRFVSMGSDQQIIGDKRGLAEALDILIDGTKVVRLIDLDDRSPEEVQEVNSKGVRVLSRRNLESYLFGNEVLEALAAYEGQPEKSQELLDRKQSILADREDLPSDNLKPVSGEIYNACKGILKLTQAGNNTQAFMRDTLALHVRPGMNVYDELKRDIFGTDPN